MAPRAQRRTQALSRERIVEAAVELLDQAGERGLTFRALTESLATGPGALYHHLADRDDLLAAATATVVSAALAVEPTGSPRQRIHAVALGLFEAIRRHPWLARQLSTQLSAAAAGPVTVGLYETLGRPVQALGAPRAAWFTATSALVHYVLGAAGQHAANAAHARSLGAAADRAEFLATVSTAWEQLDPDTHPVTRALADHLREHDDRTEFLAGVDLILAGITAHPATA